MDQEQSTDAEYSSFIEMVRANENGALYLLVGFLSAVVSLFLLQPAGLIAIYCGLRLSRDENELIRGALIAGLGLLGLVLWLAVPLVVTG